MNILKCLMAATLLLPFGVASATTSSSVNVPISITRPSGSGNDEFVGPFANWINARTGKRYDGTGSALCTAATGNGATDDTSALQSCLKALGNTSPALWIPAGTYKITAALSLTSGNNVSVIGADPATTTILWGGATNSAVMLKVQGTHYSRIDRLTFNGNNNVAVLIQQSQDNGAYFDTGNEYADDVFINAGGTFDVSIDFACGYTIGSTAIQGGNGCAETTMIRDQFTNGGWGLATGNFNAGDLWIWYSTFTNKTRAVTNVGSRSGDFHVFHNNFFNSSIADISLVPMAETTFDWNYSSGSSQFINCAFWATSSVMVAEGNTVLNTSAPQSIRCDNQGPNIFIDNVISSSTGAIAPVIFSNNTGGDVFSTGNTYTVGPANACNNSADAIYSTGRCHSVGDGIVAKSNPPAPVLPGTPPNRGPGGSKIRTIFEVPGGSSTATIQTAINSATAIGSGAVVHLQAGNYNIAPLSIPGNALIQIIGDGYNTILVNSYTHGGALIVCGPACKAWFREFVIAGNAYATSGIQISGADQPGGRVFMEQPYFVQNYAAGLFVNGLYNTNVEVHDSPMSDTQNGDAINVAGGSGASSSSTNVFAAAGGCDNKNFVRVSGNGNFSLRHLWHDRGGCTYPGETMTQVSGAGNFTFAAARTFIAGTGSPPTTGNYFNITNFSGVSALLGLVTILGDPPANQVTRGTTSGANNLTLGYVGCTSSFFSDTSPDTYYLLDPQTTPTTTCNSGAAGNEVHASESSNVSNLLSFLNTTLAPLRAALPTMPGAASDPALAANVTDARIYRVQMTQCYYGIDVEP